MSSTFALPLEGEGQGFETLSAHQKAASLRPGALILVKILAALLLGELPHDLPAGDLEEVVDVEGPNPNTVAQALEASFVRPG